VQVDAAIVLTIAFALLSRFEFETGAGTRSATQLAFVPMLFVLPPELAPALVARRASCSAACPSSCAASCRRPRRSRRSPTAGTRSGPALVLTAAGVNGAHWATGRGGCSRWSAQLAFDLAISSAREYFGTGRRPRSTCASSRRPGRWTCCSARSACSARCASEQEEFAFLLVFPLALLMWVFAGERRARLDQQIETSRTYQRTALLLGELIGEDDEYTGAHSQGVVSLSVAIADELGLAQGERRLVEFGALLHDVGKIGVPKEIVNKAGP
jgi:hypothetical protein